MNLNAKEGDKVIFTGEGGYDLENFNARQLLTVGKEYTVDRVEIGQSYSVVYLKEYLKALFGNDLCFNTVMFKQPNVKEVKAHDYKEIYQMLGYNLSKLGCLMLDVEPITTNYYQFMQDGITTHFPGYFAKNKERFWINGYVADKTPHLTLFYGFLQEAGCFKFHIEKLLEGTKIETIEIEDVSYFDSPYEDEPYYCIVAKVKKTDELMEAHNKMKLLPNIQTFPDYKPHITIAYIIKDETLRDDFISELKKQLFGKTLKVTGLNYGGNK